MARSYKTSDYCRRTGRTMSERRMLPHDSSALRRGASTRRFRQRVVRRHSVTSMGYEVTIYRRQDLFEQVWKEPMRDVARRYGVSDVAMKKTCRKLRVPGPDAGHWARGLRLSV